MRHGFADRSTSPSYKFQFQLPTMTDPTQYLAGDSDFGPALPFNDPPGLAYGDYVGPDIISFRVRGVDT